VAPKGMPLGCSQDTQRSEGLARPAGVASAGRPNVANTVAGAALVPGVLAAVEMVAPGQMLVSEGATAGMNASVGRGLGRVTWPGLARREEPAGLVAGLAS
jgi:hypothetical protein